jgi:HlyD family secretion protein
MTDQSVRKGLNAMNRRLVLVILLLAAAGGGAWYYYAGQHETAESAPVFYGNVDIREVDLGFRVAGRIERMVFDEGDRVPAGAVLAQLEKQPFLNELALQTAAISQAEANLQKLQAGSRPEEIEQARANVAARQAALENARGVFQRQQELEKRDYASRQVYENAAATLRQAEAELKSAQEAEKLAVQGPRKEDIAAAHAALEAARAQKQIAETAFHDAELKAPADGIILTRAVEPGAIVAAGTTVYTLSLQNPVWVRAYVAEPRLGTLHPGMAVEVFTDTRPSQPYAGQVGFISPVAEFTPKSVETPELRADLVYRFRVLVKDADNALRQGMPVTVRIPAGAGDVAAVAK